MRGSPRGSRHFTGPEETTRARRSRHRMIYHRSRSTLKGPRSHSAEIFERRDTVEIFLAPKSTPRTVFYIYNANFSLSAAFNISPPTPGILKTGDVLQIANGNRAVLVPWQGAARFLDRSQQVVLVEHSEY